MLASMVVPFALFIVSFCTLAVSGCGGGQTRGHPLDSSWSDEDGSELAAFQHSWSVKQTSQATRTLPNVAIGVVDDRTLVGRSFTAGGKWRFEHELEGRAQIAGSVVVGMGGGFVFALDAATGQQLWERKALGSLRGASDDGTTTLVSIASLSGQSSIVLAVSRDGIVTRQLYEHAAIGNPAVLDAYAFLPWNRDLVIIFDLIEGTEAARVVSAHPVSHAFLVGDELFFGENTAVRFDADVVQARRGGGTRVELPKRRLPGAPQWRLPGSAPLPMVASWHDSVRFYARPRRGPSTVTIDHYALSYYRLAIGLTAPTGTTRWAHVGNAAHIGGAAGTKTVALCDVSGTVKWLDVDSGKELHVETFGESLVACMVQSDGPPGARPPQPDRLAPTKRASQQPPLERQLLAAIAVREQHLVPMQLELLEDLSAINGEQATRALIEQARVRRHEPAYRRAVQQRAEQLLEARRSGIGAMLADLAAPWSESLPIAALSTAVASSGATEAAPLLAAHLNDPRWGPEQLEAIAASLERLASSQQRRALALFLARFRCHEPRLASAVLAVARTLVKLGAAHLVTRVVLEGCEHEALKSSLAAAVGADMSYPQ